MRKLILKIGHIHQVYILSHNKEMSYKPPTVVFNRGKNMEGSIKATKYKPNEKIGLKYVIVLEHAKNQIN